MLFFNEVGNMVITGHDYENGSTHATKRFVVKARAY